MGYKTVLDNLTSEDRVWKTCLESLFEFGFKDLTRNLDLSHKYKGAIDQIVSELMAEEPVQNV